MFPRGVCFGRNLRLEAGGGRQLSSVLSDMVQNVPVQSMHEHLRGAQHSFADLEQCVGCPVPPAPTPFFPPATDKRCSAGGVHADLNMEAKKSR